MSGRSNAGRKLGKAELKNRSPSIADWPLTFRLPFGLLQEHSFGLRLRTLLEIGLDLIDQSPCFRRPNFERRVHLRLDFIAFVFFATFLAVLMKSPRPSKESIIEPMHFMFPAIRSQTLIASR